MKKILITLPNSIAGTLIMKGFKQGFTSNGKYVLEKDLRELTIDEIEKFKPDVIFGYDYGFLFSDDEKLKASIKNYAKNNSVKFVHYFADEPDGKYAYVNKPKLFNEFKLFEKEFNAVSFVWDKEFLNEFENSLFLPLAVNYKAYRVNDDFLQKNYDISFVGRPLTDKRQKVLAALIKTFKNKLSIFSYENHFLQSLDDMKNKKLLTEEELEIYKCSYKGFLKTEKELADVYFRTKVNVNITLQGESGLNYRVFEVPASRGFLITDNMSGIEKMFDISKEIEVYEDIPDLVDKISFYLKNQYIAEKIALAGFAATARKHSYTARAKFVLDNI